VSTPTYVLSKRVQRALARRPCATSRKSYTAPKKPQKPRLKEPHGNRPDNKTWAHVPSSGRPACDIRTAGNRLAPHSQLKPTWSRAPPQPGDHAAEYRRGFGGSSALRTKPHVGPSTRTGAGRRDRTRSTAPQVKRSPSKSCRGCNGSHPALGPGGTMSGQNTDSTASYHPGSRRKTTTTHDFLRDRETLALHGNTSGTRIQSRSQGGRSCARAHSPRVPATTSGCAA